MKEKLKDIISKMTLEEKVSQMVHEAKAVERLGIAEYNWIIRDLMASMKIQQCKEIRNYHAVKTPFIPENLY